MLSIVLIAGAIVAATVAVHAVGLALVLSHVATHQAEPPRRLWPVTWLLIRVAWLLLIIHGVEISLWALFYLREQCLPHAESAFYSSGVTYTTIGYGDVVLSRPWRMLAPIEGATGILMCGLSTGTFFAVVSRIYPARSASSTQ
jgi:hypothetical protein